MRAPTNQTLHAVRAGEGSFIHHLSREDRPLNLHPHSASVLGLYRGEGVFLRTVFCLYNRTWSQESPSHKIPSIPGLVKRTCLKTVLAKPVFSHFYLQGTDKSVIKNNVTKSHKRKRRISF